MKIVREIDEQKVTWGQLHKHFKDKYLNEQFYDDKAKEFHDLKLGQQMDEFIAMFTSMLGYFPYIQEEKAKFQRFINNL